MSGFVRWLVGVVVFVLVMLVGEALFDLHPTFGEMLLVIVACALSAGVREAMQ